MEKEKEEWLKTIGAKEFPEPIKWVYSFPEYEGTFNLSERYVKETPLDELKDQYMRNKAHADELLKRCEMEAKRIAEIHQHCCQQSIETVLEHFGISHKELSKTEPFSEVKNNPNTRKAYGIDRILKNRRIQKARIIIDYDADFPEIVIRVFSKDSQKHQYRVEEKKRQDETE